jgi:hypothetical protein
VSCVSTSTHVSCVSTSVYIRSLSFLCCLFFYLSLLFILRIYLPFSLSSVSIVSGVRSSKPSLVRPSPVFTRPARCSLVLSVRPFSRRIHPSTSRLHHLSMSAVSHLPANLVTRRLPTHRPCPSTITVRPPADCVSHRPPPACPLTASPAARLSATTLDFVRSRGGRRGTTLRKFLACHS